MSEARGRLLAVFAHPDDETFGVGGTMALLRSRGWEVTMLCATRGEVGEIADPSLATPETLGQVREQELRRACAVLGVTDVRFLDYRDSGMAGTADNADPRALCNAELDVVAGEIAALIRAVRPRVGVTWDPSGGYGHPDHVMVHRCATAAFERTTEEDGGPGALYYSAIDRARFAELAEELAKRGIAFGNQRLRDEAARLPEVPITTRIDVSEFVELKRRAFAEHKTQMPADSFVSRLPPEVGRRFFAYETFHRASPAWREGDPAEGIFWDGEKAAV